MVHDLTLHIGDIVTVFGFLDSVRILSEALSLRTILFIIDMQVRVFIITNTWRIILELKLLGSVTIVDR